MESRYRFLVNHSWRHQPGSATTINNADGGVSFSFTVTQARTCGSRCMYLNPKYAPVTPAPITAALANIPCVFVMYIFTG